METESTTILYAQLSYGQLFQVRTQNLRSTLTIHIEDKLGGLFLL